MLPLSPLVYYEAVKKKPQKQKMYKRIVSMFASRWFWRAMLGLFLVQAVYIALVGRYSMAFDEHFHLAAIKQYAEVIFPWQVTQPPGPAELSAFTADGSYLYHYVMSFPYRLMQLMTSSQTAHIVMLRLLDIGIFFAGICVFRRLLLELKLSRAAAHFIMVIVMLMPMTPFLAGQLTYDTLFFTLCGVTVLFLMRLVRALHATSLVPLKALAWSTTLVLLTVQVKYAFFPAALGAALYLIGLFSWLLYKKKVKWLAVWRSWRGAARQGSGMVAIGVLLLSGVLFVQRYGMNYVQYGALVPDCQVVLSHERCLGFAPYGRDASIRSHNWHKTITTKQKLAYVSKWYEKMIRESYFAVAPREAGYRSVHPLPVAVTAGKVLAAVGLLAIVLRLPWLLRSGPMVGLALAIVVGYSVFLFAKNYAAFIYTAVPLSIHGRYILPFLPLMGYLVYVALWPLVRKLKMQTAAMVFAGLLFAASLWGGGIAVFIIGSDDAWYWDHMTELSHVVRDITARLIIH